MWRYLALLLWALPAIAGPAKSALRAAAVHLPNGSGAIVAAPVTGHKYILTNWHVCHKYGSALVRYPDGAEIESLVYKSDAGKDLCALLVDQSRPSLQVAKAAPRVGAYLATKGWPGGEMRESEGKVLHLERMHIDFVREVKECPDALHAEYDEQGLTECSGDYDFIRTDLYCEPGSSGSPVVNSRGELVGVMQTWEGPSNLRSGGVLPLEYIKAFLKGL